MRLTLVRQPTAFAARCVPGQAVVRSSRLFLGAAAPAGLARTAMVAALTPGVDLRAYRTLLFERVPACRDGGGLYADLTPAAYKEAQERVAA